MEKAELQNVLDWANEKLATGEQPPWAWYQYMKLRETLEAIIPGLPDATKENLPQSVPHQEMHLRLVDANDQQDNVQRHPSDAKVHLPM